MADYTTAVLLFAYLASVLHLLLRRTPCLFRYLSRFHMQPMWCVLYGHPSPSVSLGGRRNHLWPCFLSQWVWEWSCDSVCAKDAQRGVCWGPLVVVFFILWERFFSEFCSIRGLEALQPPSIQQELEGALGREPEPWASQGHCLRASGFSQLGKSSELGSPGFMSHFTLYLSLFHLHFSVTCRLKFPSYDPLLQELGLYFPILVYSHSISACLFFSFSSIHL